MAEGEAAVDRPDAALFGSLASLPEIRFLSQAVREVFEELRRQVKKEVQRFAPGRPDLVRTPESARQYRDDGTARAIDVKVVRGGRVISKAARGGDYFVRRLAVPQMNYAVYLVFLGLLALLLAFPAVLRRLGGKGAGA